MTPALRAARLPLRLLMGVGLLAWAGCSRDPAPAPPAGSVATRSLSETASTRSAAPAPAAGVAGSTTRGEIGGVPYLEYMTGGARPDERVPMIVALHPMGGDPVDFLQMFRQYPRPARFILPYGRPSGGMYIWFDAVGDDVSRAQAMQEADRIATALAALVAVRPTVGKPLVTGFSQGGTLAFSLAVTHPETLAAAFPISGLLPLSLYPTGAGAHPAALPPVVAFHGASDLAVPAQSARDSIAVLQHAGYKAELHEYAGLEHATSRQEEREIFERIGQLADGLAKP